MSLIPKNHPANEIAEAPDFPSALRLLAEALVHEGNVLARLDDECGVYRSGDAYWYDEAEKAREALRMYNAAVADAMKAVKADLVRQYREKGMTTIADALEADDLSLMAF